MQADTIHFVQRDGGRFYVYTLIDLFSRAAYAEYSPKCNQRASFRFVMRGQDYLGILLVMVQTDNGPEFGKWFHDQLSSKGIALRHSRVHKSNDNAHIERYPRRVFISNHTRINCAGKDLLVSRILQPVQAALKH